MCKLDDVDNGVQATLRFWIREAEVLFWEPVVLLEGRRELSLESRETFISEVRDFVLPP